MDKNLLPKPEDLSQLSSVTDSSTVLLANIVRTIGVPRTVVPDDEQITYGMRDLPRELKKIPANLRDKFIARATIAASVGLFDSSMNYVWNSVISELRKKVSNFGYEMIKHIKGDRVEDNYLNDITDDSLLTLCRQLNILTEEGYYYLNQCRDLRNHVSAAHPSYIEIDDRELISFFNRCAKYGLANSFEENGIDFKNLTNVLSSSQTTGSNLQALSDAIKKTFLAQKDFILYFLYANYIDIQDSEVKRNNSLALAILLSSELTEDTILKIISRHSKLKTNKDEKSIKASTKFLEETGLLAYLDDIEIINIFDKAIGNLNRIHTEMNNFYNEPPFAERLQELSVQIKPIPDVIQKPFLGCVLTCYFGNAYGVSDSAMPYYESIFKNLTPKEIDYLLKVLSTNNEFMKPVINIGWKKELLNKLVGLLSQNVQEQDDLVANFNYLKKKYSL